VTVVVTTVRRYDLGALKRASRLTDPELALLLGLSERQVLRKKVEGLTWLEADRYAVACGWHPAAIWHGWDGDRDVTPLADNGA